MKNKLNTEVGESRPKENVTQSYWIAPRQPSSESTHDKTCEFCGQVEDPGICCEDSTAMIVEAEHSEPAKEGK